MVRFYVIICIIFNTFFGGYDVTNPAAIFMYSASKIYVQSLSRSFERMTF